MRITLLLIALTCSLAIWSQTPEIHVKTNKIGVNTSVPTKQFHIEGYDDVSTGILYSKVNYSNASDVRAIEGISTPTLGYGIAGYFTGGYMGIKAIGQGLNYTGPDPVYAIYAQSTGVSSSGERIGIFSEAYGGNINIAAKFGGGDVEIANAIRIGSTNQNGRVYVRNDNQSFGTVASAMRIESFHNGTEQSYGIYTTGENSGGGTAYGLRAQGNNTSNGDSYGVRALAYKSGGSGNAFGVHTAVSESQGWALYSIGKNYMSGDLRVGTTSEPYAGEYLVVVDGKILTEEVRVQNSTAWPDYVFEKEYDLLTLEELESSIKSNKHLPGIPSAKEIERDGIALGDMQTRMMEKIEELTLYIIQQQKEIDQLKALLETSASNK